jgi:hypothetical protein
MAAENGTDLDSINDEKHQWEYTTTVDLESVAGITLEVTAKDRAGNVDQRSQRVPS